MNTRLLAPLLLAAAAAALPAELAWADPPPWAPAHGYRAKHQYVYYPVHEIYYEPARDIWFWIDGGNWRFGSSLPIEYQPYTRGGVTVELYTDRPYEDHAVVVEHYGRGPRAVERHYRTAPVVVEEHHYHGSVPAKGHKSKGEKSKGEKSKGEKSKGHGHGHGKDKHGKHGHDH